MCAISQNDFHPGSNHDEVPPPSLITSFRVVLSLVTSALLLPRPPSPPGSAHDSGTQFLTAGAGGWAPQDQGLSHGGGFGISTLVPFHLLSLLSLDKPDVVTHHQNVITSSLNPVALTYVCALGLPACTRKYFHLNRSDECDCSELLQHS